ncbi:MAG: heme exporter protein CcmB [Bacteroidia bacterium]|nr:heme exporter protein CcmB [Bacteroidia bacterium]
MSFVTEVGALLKKEILLEWKQKYAINGLLLYVASMVFVIALAFRQEISPVAWNVVFWIIMLFVAINAIAKSFMGESEGQSLYLYTLAGPHAVLASKMLYNALLMVITGFITLFAFVFFSPVHMGDPWMYCGVVLLGGLGFAANLTLVSAIASRAQNKATLLAVLSFPLTIPMLLTAISAGKNAIDGLDRSFSLDELLFLGVFIVIIAMVSFILFPFLWRE